MSYIKEQIVALMKDFNNPPRIRVQENEILALQKLERYATSEEFSWSVIEEMMNILPADTYGQLLSGLVAINQVEAMEFIRSVLFSPTQETSSKWVVRIFALMSSLLTDGKKFVVPILGCLYEKLTHRRDGIKKRPNKKIVRHVQKNLLCRDFIEKLFDVPIADLEPCDADIRRIELLFEICLSSVEEKSQESLRRRIEGWIYPSGSAPFELGVADSEANSDSPQGNLSENRNDSREHEVKPVRVSVRSEDHKQHKLEVDSNSMQDSEPQSPEDTVLCGLPGNGDVAACLQHIGEQYAIAGQKIQALRLQLSRARADLEHSRQQLERLVSEKNEIQQEYELAVMAKKEITGKLEALSVEFEKLTLDSSRRISSLKKDIETLTRQTSHQSRYLLGEFKVSLGEKLKYEKQDFDEVIDETMTVEMGTSLKKQMQRIFRMLESSGVVM